MERYVNVMLDAGFKAVFGVKQVAIDFINAALQGERRVKDLTYLDKEIQPEVVEQRTVIFDILCEDVDGSKFILEMGLKSKEIEQLLIRRLKPTANGPVTIPALLMTDGL